MSTKVSELIREIEAFMRGKDWSSTPQFRRMYTAYCDYCGDVATALDACRVLIEQGTLDEARRRNLAADPPLTARVKMLQFAQKKEFVELALSYGFPAPIEADMKLVEKLEAPISKEEKNLQQLMRRWRQIARAGKTTEKIVLLREIIALIPQDGTLEWKKSLASFERSRDAEIAELLAKTAWTLDNLAQLESVNLELNFPKRLTVAPENTRKRVRELLIPLQKQHVTELIEKKLDMLQASYAERNLAVLNQQFAELLALTSHPLAKLTSAQQQIRQDIGAFLQMENRRRQAQERYDQLIQELGKAFEEAKPYEEIERIYNELRLLDLPLPASLVERCDVLQSEHESQERRRTIRRGIYAVGVVVLLLITLGVSIHYAMHFRGVLQSCNSFDKLLNANDFNTVIAKYDELLKKSPRIAGDPKVVARLHRAHSMRDTAKKMQGRANAEFLRARARLEALKAGDFLDSQEIDATFAEVEKMRPYLSKENLDAWGILKGEIARRRIELRQLRKKDFLNHYQQYLAQLRELKASTATAPDIAACEATLRTIREKYQKERDLLHPSVREEIGKACDAEWKQVNGDVDFALAREKETREFYRHLDHPQVLSEHLQALRDVALKRPDLARKYQGVSEADLARFEQLDSDIRFLARNDLKAILAGMTKIPDDGKNSLLGIDLVYTATDPQAPSVDDALDKLLKALDYYEVAVKTNAGPDIVLYAKEKPQVQRVNRETVRGVRIQAFLAVNAKKPVPVIIKIRGENGYTLTCNEKQLPYFANLPPIVALSGIDLAADECVKNGTFLRLQSVRQERSWSREKKLRTFLEKECAQKEKNPLIQLVAIRKAFQLLAAESQLYSELTKPVLEKLDAAAAAFKGNLLQPHTLTHPDEIRAVIAEIDPAKLFQQKEKIAHFYLHLLKRNLDCVGVIDQAGKVAWLPGQSPKEVLVFADGGLRLLAMDQDQTGDQEKKYLYPGQVLWGFTDGTSNRDFFRRETLDGARFLKLPAQWPVNLHLSIY